MPKDAGYIGVRQHSRSGLWEAEIHLRDTHERITLGTYETAEEAARAHDEAVRLMYGYDATPNFPVPDPGDDYPSTQSRSPSLLSQEIRAKLRRLYLVHNNELLFADSLWLATFPTF